MTKALFIGRFAPPHKGHIAAIKDIMDRYGEIVIGLGSCYEAGSPRHPFLAIHREKMILLSLFNEGVDLSRVKIAHVPDVQDDKDDKGQPIPGTGWDNWFVNILDLIQKENVTCFATGNEEDILGVMDKRGIKLDLDFYNPEKNSNVPYHATDLRHAIEIGDYNKFIEIAASGTVQLMGNFNGFEGIRQAILNEGPKFYPGRQTADVVLTLSEKHYTTMGRIYYTNYVLCGLRPDIQGKDFGNYYGIIGDEVRKFESPTDTVLRVLNEKAEMKVTMENGLFEPAHLLFDIPKRQISTLEFSSLFNDSALAGRYGGSSICFHAPLYGSPNEIPISNNTPYLIDKRWMRIEDALEQDFAYEQKTMIKKIANKIAS